MSGILGLEKPTVLGETLQNGAKDHDPRAEHDGPAAAEALGEPWRKRDSEDGTELVARVDEAEKTGLDGELLAGGVLGVLASVAQVWEPVVSDCVSQKDAVYIHSWKGWANWRVLMSCESKPEVISTPMQHRKRKMYINRRFGFLYHITLSSWTRRVTMGSALVPTLTFMAGILTLRAGTCRCCLRSSSGATPWGRRSYVRTRGPTVSAPCPRLSCESRGPGSVLAAWFSILQPPAVPWRSSPPPD